MKRFVTILSAVIIASSALSASEPAAARRNKANTEEPTAAPVGDPITAEQLAGEWSFFTVNGNRVTGEERPVITFDGARFYGNNGCNVINGAFTLKGHEIRFSHILATMRLCADAPYEYLINTGLPNIRSYVFRQSGREYYLDLMNERGLSSIVLRKHNMDFINGAWRVTRINGEPNTNENVELVFDIDEHKVHGNTGCNILNGTIFIDPDKSNSIQFLNLCITRAACPENNVETAMLVALEEAETALATGKDILSISDSNGHEILQLKRLKVR